MNEKQLAELLGISRDDQTASEWSTFARNIAQATISYYRTLIESGMSPEDARALTENFQPAYLGMLGSMAALQNAMKQKPD